jgi:uncharacterized protein DUF1707
VNDRQPALRASDADRERVARILGEHGAAGRLTPEELEQRLCVGIWLAAGASGSFWPIWVILVAAVGLARASWRTLGPGAGLTDEQLGTHRRGRRRR